MKKNMGNADKLIRAIVALVIIGVYISGLVTGLTGIILLVISAIFILTSLVSFCPLYSLFGINTCPRTKKIS